MGQLRVSAQRDQVASSPITTVPGAGAGLSACDTVTLTAMAERLCPGPRCLVTEFVGDSRCMSEKRE